MDAQTALKYQWPYLRSFLAEEADLEASARDTGALVRRREVGSASDLLRLALAYGFCGLSLRETAAWAEANGIASISNVALLKRLRASANWLGTVARGKVGCPRSSLHRECWSLHPAPRRRDRSEQTGQRRHGLASSSVLQPKHALG